MPILTYYKFRLQRLLVTSYSLHVFLLPGESPAIKDYCIYETVYTTTIGRLGGTKTGGGAGVVEPLPFEIDKMGGGRKCRLNLKELTNFHVKVF